MDILTGKKTFTSLKPLDLARCTKQEIIDYFINSYDLYESLFLGLKDESVFYKSPDRLRLPLVFYFAHTAVVYANKLVLAGFIKERVNYQFETMFETGVNEMSWDDTENYRMGGSLKWPPIKEVVDYRRKMRELILQVIRDTPLKLPITMESPWWAVTMGIEHERIHLETSSVLIRQLPANLVTCPPGWKYAPFQGDFPVKTNKMITVPGAEVTLGKPEDFPSFGWDNEYGKATYNVPSFEASQYMVTNKEFLEFVNADGYLSRDLWTLEGWEWAQLRQAKHPTFWVCYQGCKSGCGADLAKETHCPPRPALINGSTNGDSQDCKKAKIREYKLRLLYDVVNLPLDWPVVVNYHEARAFCTWKGEGYRMPTEAEHHIIRGPQLPVSKGTACDIIYQDDMQANLNLQYGSSTPVNMYPASATGHHDTMGNLFEWVEDHFNGLPGFQSHFLYDDYSTNSYDGKHNVMLGGSWITAGYHGSRFARNAYRRHFFPICGFRVARSKELASELPAMAVETEVFVLGTGVDETEDWAHANKDIMKWEPSFNTDYIHDTCETLKGVLEIEFGIRDNFAQAAAIVCCTYCQSNGINMNSAVHIGSATGRATFEFSKTFDRVLGLETYARLIDTAINLQSEQAVTLKDGSLVQLDPKYNMDRVVFKQLTWIANEVDSHDLVLLTNLDRAANAKAWLVRLWEITKHHGVAVIASKDYAWDKKALEPFLNNRLICVEEENMPFSDLEGERTAAVTFWKRID